MDVLQHLELTVLPSSGLADRDIPAEVAREAGGH